MTVETCQHALHAYARVPRACFFRDSVVCRVVQVSSVPPPWLAPAACCPPPLSAFNATRATVLAASVGRAPTDRRPSSQSDPNLRPAFPPSSPQDATAPVARSVHGHTHRRGHCPVPDRIGSRVRPRQSHQSVCRTRHAVAGSEGSFAQTCVDAGSAATRGRRGTDALLSRG